MLLPLLLSENCPQEQEYEGHEHDPARPIGGGNPGRVRSALVSLESVLLKHGEAVRGYANQNCDKGIRPQPRFESSAESRAKHEGPNPSQEVEALYFRADDIHKTSPLPKVGL